MCLTIRGNDFNFFFFQCQQAKNRARTAKMDPKIDTFGQFDTRDLAILTVKKNRFLDFFNVFLELLGKCLGFVFGLRGPTFGCMFWTCLGSVWALFLASKCIFLGVF